MSETLSIESIILSGILNECEALHGKSLSEIKGIVSDLGIEELVDSGDEDDKDVLCSLVAAFTSLQSGESARVDAQPPRKRRRTGEESERPFPLASLPTNLIPDIRGYLDQESDIELRKAGSSFRYGPTRGKTTLSLNREKLTLDDEESITTLVNSIQERYPRGITTLYLINFEGEPEAIDIMFYRVIPALINWGESGESVDEGASGVRRERLKRVILDSTLDNEDVEEDFFELLTVIDNPSITLVEDSGGWTLLQYSTMAGYVEFTRRLLEMGAETERENSYGNTPLALTMEKYQQFPQAEKYRQIIDLLLRSGANPDITYSYVVNVGGAEDEVILRHITSTPLIAAIQLRDLNLIEDLLSHGADSNFGYVVEESREGRGEGNYPLREVILLSDRDSTDSTSLDIVKMLVRSGADVNKKVYEDDSGVRVKETPLSLAVSKNREDIVQYLLERGADVNLEYPGGTILFRALDKPRILNLLLKQGANPDVEYIGISLLDFATLFGYDESVSTIISEYLEEMRDDNEE